VRHTMTAAAAVTALFVSQAASAGWEPTKPVEIVVAAGAGGASDQMARMMQAAIQKNNLMKQPTVVSLKGGASGAEALMYMNAERGRSEQDPDRLFADLHAAAVGEDPVRLAGADAGRGDRARAVCKDEIVANYEAIARSDMATERHLIVNRLVVLQVCRVAGVNRGYLLHRTLLQGRNGRNFEMM
jgi:hypothetical protein